MLHDDKILRVCIHKDRNIVSIVNLDKNALDTTDEGIYINVDDVPDWIQRKLAGGDEADCFWVYKDC